MMSITEKRNAAVIRFAHEVADGVLRGNVRMHEVVNGYTKGGKGWYAFERGLREKLHPGIYLSPAERERVKNNAKTLVLVYGTLKKGNGNHRLLTSSQFLGKAETVAKMALCGTGIPFVHRAAFVPERFAHALGHIQGELYAVTPEVLENLDRLEGHPQFYTRTKVSVRLDVPEAIIYLDGQARRKFFADMYLMERPLANTPQVPIDGKLDWDDGSRFSRRA